MAYCRFVGEILSYSLAQHTGRVMRIYFVFSPTVAYLDRHKSLECKHCLACKQNGSLILGLSRHKLELLMNKNVSGLKNDPFMIFPLDMYFKQ